MSIHLRVDQKELKNFEMVEDKYLDPKTVMLIDVLVGLTNNKGVNEVDSIPLGNVRHIAIKEKPMTSMVIDPKTHLDR